MFSREDVTSYALEHGCELDAYASKRLLRFMNTLDMWRQQMNLVGVKTKHALLDVCLLDACQLVALGWLKDIDSVVDVGSGAGLPAIPLAVMQPHLHITCVEPLQKRVAFMRHAIGGAKMINPPQIIRGKIEDMDFDGSFDLAMSRATFDPTSWIDRGMTLSQCVLAFWGEHTPPSKQHRRFIINEHAYTLASTKSTHHVALFSQSE